MSEIGIVMAYWLTGCFVVAGAVPENSNRTLASLAVLVWPIVVVAKVIVLLTEIGDK